MQGLGLCIHVVLIQQLRLCNDGGFMPPLAAHVTTLSYSLHTIHTGSPVDLRILEISSAGP